MRPFVTAFLAVMIAALPGAAPRVSGQAAPAEEVHVAFIGDSGTGDSHQRAVRDQVVRDAPTHVFLLGDNIYTEGSRRYFGSRFDEIYAPLLSKGIPFHASLGNHDVEGCDATPINPLPADGRAYVVDGLRCDVRHQLLHGPFGYVRNLRYYSVALPTASPLMEIFVLDSNTLRTSQSKLLLREDTAQLQWLDQALAASTSRWKVVIMHHPMHSPTTGAKNFFFVPVGGGRTREFQLEQQLAPILRRHRVDVVFAGHNHFYARMLPQEGIRYFVSGGGGRKTYGFESARGYVAAGGAWYHFVSVRVTPTSFAYRAIDSAGVLRDSGWWAKGDAADRALPVIAPPAGGR